MTGQDAYTGWYNKATGFYDSLQSMGERLKERIAYDGNGNIQKYLRKAITGDDAHMDSLNYYYYANTNQLRRITDSIPASAYVSPDNNIIDIDNQPDNNYAYDAIGNLVKDSAEKITNIKWNVYGKIQEITKKDGSDITTIKYTYDASGNRISQVVISPLGDQAFTWYVRDAQGNILYTYIAAGSTSSNLEDLDLRIGDRVLYGSSRLGTFNAANESVHDGPDPTQYYYDGRPLSYDRGWKQYELTNHLGNVLATISDRKFGVSLSDTSSLIAYYEPHIVTAQDYYPFGMMSRVALPNSGVPYRFGFNGKLNDNEVKGMGNQQDYGMRIYDPRVGRFLSKDPLQVNFPFYTPYQFAGNKPIWAVDLDGREEIVYNLVNAKNSEGKPVLAFHFVEKRDYNPISKKFAQLVGDPTTVFLMYNGEQLGAYSSVEEMKSATHGKTVDQIRKARIDQDRRNMLGFGALHAHESLKASEKVGGARGAAAAEEEAAASRAAFKDAAAAESSTSVQRITAKETWMPKDGGAMGYTIQDGRINLSGRSVTNGKFDFVVTQDGQLVIGRRHFALSDGAESVQAAGTLRIYKGKITEITNNSGHYKPSASETENSENH